MSKELWEKCAAFHGHVCGGLTIGYKAALYAIELLDLSFSDDEQVVCISENDACGVDAIQVILGCSVGKGNLLFHMRGKQAFSTYSLSVISLFSAKPLVLQFSYHNYKKEKFITSPQGGYIMIKNTEPHTVFHMRFSSYFHSSFPLQVTPLPR